VRPDSGLRTVALFEALKGSVVLVAGFGVLSFLGQDAERLAAELVQRTHLNPARHYPQIFVHAMAGVTDAGLWRLAGLAGLYSLVRFLEAYGLWHGRPWASWLAALSGGIYVPLELVELARGPSWVKAAALVINLSIVAYMVWVLRRQRLATNRTAGG
jgi:uncharacterized membrane protein (DUF2068 family)